MVNLGKITALVWVLAGMGATVAHAESYADITSTNNSSHSVWVTYYTIGKNQLGTACIHASNKLNEQFDWANVIASGGGVYLRFEYKQNTDCGGKTLYDSGYGGAYQMPALGQTLTVNIPAH